jgi:transposase
MPGALEGLLLLDKYPNALLFRRLRLHHDTRFSLNFTALSPILIMHIRHLGRGERVMDWKKLLGSIPASVDEELRLRNAYVVAENRMLRQQIKGRVLLQDSDRKVLAELGQQLGKKALEEIATIAKADTILAWHRKYVDQQVDTSASLKSVGRPRIDKEIEDVVIRMAREHRSWGYDRIMGALANLGYTMSDQTVGNILKRHGIPPAPERKMTMTWHEFIRTHMDVLVATDFFTSALWTWVRVVISFILFFLHCSRHTICGARMTLHHHVGWMLSLSRSFASQSFVERWVRWVKKAALCRLRLCGPGGRRYSLVAGTIAHLPASPSRERRNVVLMPAVNTCQIRDGPRRYRQQHAALRPNTNLKAA